MLIGRGHRLPRCRHVDQEDLIAGRDRWERRSPPALLALRDLLDRSLRFRHVLFRRLDGLRALEDIQALRLLQLARCVSQPRAHLRELRLHVALRLVDEPRAVRFQRLKLLRHPLPRPLRVPRRRSLLRARALRRLPLPVEVRDQRLDSEAVGVDAPARFLEDAFGHPQPLCDGQCI